MDDQRRKSVFTQGSATTTRYYLDDYEEVYKPDGTTQKIHYLSGGSMMLQQGAAKSLYYGYHDYQGSLIAWTNQSGTVVERRAYDPWGRHRNPQNWTEVDYTSPSQLNNRGYTGHEHLDASQIINMNGRVYDPLTAQFFSPDPFVQAPDNWLNYNRYAYCLNNPLIYTDPDGEWIHIVVGAVVGGIINVATNWDNLDDFGEGLASFGIGAATGALTAVNPALGAVVGGAFTSAGNNVIAQTGNGVGLNQVNWGQVGGQAVLGAVVGGVTYGVGSAINQTGITNKILDASGITNNVVRNIVGSTVNGVMVGTTAGLARGVGTGLLTGEWNVWEHTWKGAAYGGAGGFLYGSLTELGYQAQLKFGRNDALNSKNTDAIAKGGQRYVNRLQKIDGSNNGGSGNSATGQGMGEITVVYNTQTGTTTVSITVSPNSYWQPPAPYQYNSPTIYQNILRINKQQ